MKHFSYNFLLLGLVGLFFSGSVQAQCTYTARASGSFLAPGTFAVTGAPAGGGGACSAVPTPGSADVIIIGNNHVVTLDGGYALGTGGTITVAGGGALVVTNGGTLLLPSTASTTNSLIIEDKSALAIRTGGSVRGGNLLLGNGKGSDSQTTFIVEAGASQAVVFEQVTINKAALTINSGARLNITCNLVLLNSEILDNGVFSIGGNLDLSNGGASNTLCGSGGLAVQGCVFGGNGATQRIVSNCAGQLTSPTICAQQQPSPGCSGPLSATNANEAACDALVSNTRECFGTVLPVELVLFTATATPEGRVELLWITASEKNNAGFAVERSADGRSFRSIRAVAGVGNSQGRSTYRAADEEPLPGGSYYRLRQTDFDGHSTYSPVRAVKLGRASAKSLEVYPGPAAQEWVVNCTLPAELAAGGSVRVYDALGRLQQVSAVPSTARAGRWTLDLHVLPTGVYIARLVSGAGSFSQRVMK